MDSNPLGLYIPLKSVNFIDAPYLKPRDAEQWISNLPAAHIGETARLIYKAMSELNRVTMAPNQRFKILEMFRKPFSYVSESLSKHYIGQAFPLSQKNQKIAELTKELCLELAIGYKIIIDDSLSQKNGRVDKKVLRISIYRAMQQLGESLFKSYMVYEPPSGQTWMEIHHLYLFSEHNGMIAEIIKDPIEPKLGSNTISLLYKQIILLSLANPYRLPQSEIKKVNNALRSWSRYCQLNLLDDPNNPIGLFSIDLEHNTPPSYYNSTQPNESSEFIRILDTSELTRILREQVNNKQENELGNTQQSALNPNEITTETLRKLILAWGAIPKRNFSRNGKTDNVKVALGLSASHSFIQKQQDAIQIEHARLNGEDFADSEVIFSEKAKFRSIPVKKIGESGNQPDIWDIAQNPNIRSRKNYGANSFQAIEEFQNSSHMLDMREEIYDSYDCVLVNESAGGFCIKWKTTASTKTGVGSLIGVIADVDEDEWSIGVIRWIKSINSKTMYIGIELLSPSAKAVAAKNVSRSGSSNEYSRCLLLPELHTVKQPQTLVTQSLFSVGDKLELDVQGQPIKVKLTKLLENTGTFNQFLFSIIKTVKKAPSVDEIDKMKNFDSIWSSI